MKKWGHSIPEKIWRPSPPEKKTKKIEPVFFQISAVKMKSAQTWALSNHQHGQVVFGTANPCSASVEKERKMGHSKSIKDLKKQNADFSDYIKAATDNLNKRAQPELKKFNDMVDSYYSKNDWDQQPIGKGANADYRQAAEFSVASIQKSLQSVANSVFMGGAPTDGFSLSQDAKAVAKIAAELTSFQALALSAATAFVTQILGAFSTKIETEYHSDMVSKSIAPGLTLHTWYYGDSFHKEDYFNDQYIIETVIRFKLIYSFAQNEMQQDIDYMRAHDQEISDLDAKIVQMQGKINKWAMGSDKEFDKAQKYEARIKFLKTNLATYRDEVDQLVKKYRH